MKLPRIIIAGTNSGCGKTTVTAAVLSALKKRGLKIQPYKVGPDYIDPMFHTFITGRQSRNLDSWMLNGDTVRYLLARNFSGADLAVIEGVMGLYDGFEGCSTEGSTAHVAEITESPVILVLNAEGMSLSVAALIKGFVNFESGNNIKGVIFNNIESRSHFELLKGITQEQTGLAVIGYLAREEEYVLKSRHLGLVPCGEIGTLDEMADRMGAAAIETIDIELLLKIAGCAPAINTTQDISLGSEFKAAPVKVAVAMDKAFNFYYRDNLDLLEMMGVEIQYFSPLEDKKLPDGVDGLYIGGGYPEVFAGELSENSSVREGIKNKIADGLPTYAECGGFMYLTESIKNADGLFDMVGVYPGRSEMTDRLQRFGYVEVEVVENNVIPESGYKIRAHEFHYSRVEMNEGIEACFKVHKSRRGSEISSWKCGFKLYNALAGYPHIHFWSNMDFAKRIRRRFSDTHG